MILAVLAATGCAANGERDLALGLVSMDVKDVPLDRHVLLVKRSQTS